MIETALPPREVPLVGGMKVRRVLPLRGGRLVGPFAFLDEMGPLQTAPGDIGDVPPHPHIGLSTVTYLFEGRILHRDNLGTVQTIAPGDVNWMTAGKGIVHSERITDEWRRDGMRLHGLQAWVALPREQEDRAPSFEHHPDEKLPRFSVGGVEIHLIAGDVLGRRSRVATFSKLFYFSATFRAGAALEFDPGTQESAFYLLLGEVEIEERKFQAPMLVVFKPGEPIRVKAAKESLGVFLGGERLEGERHIDWNFVSSSRETIERAKTDWLAQRYPRVPGETEFVPLPPQR